MFEIGHTSKQISSCLARSTRYGKRCIWKPWPIRFVPSNIASWILYDFFLFVSPQWKKHGKPRLPLPFPSSFTNKFFFAGTIWSIKVLIYGVMSSSLIRSKPVTKFEIHSSSLPVIYLIWSSIRSMCHLPNHLWPVIIILSSKYGYFSFNSKYTSFHNCSSSSNGILTLSSLYRFPVMCLISIMKTFYSKHFSKPNLIDFLKNGLYLIIS